MHVTSNVAHLNLCMCVWVIFCPLCASVMCASAEHVSVSDVAVALLFIVFLADSSRGHTGTQISTGMRLCPAQEPLHARLQRKSKNKLPKLFFSPTSLSLSPGLLFLYTNATLFPILSLPCAHQPCSYPRSRFLATIFCTTRWIAAASWSAHCVLPIQQGSHYGANSTQENAVPRRTFWALVRAVLR